MKNIDELLKQILVDLATVIRTQQAEIEWLKGEYARGINAALSVPREFDDLVSISSIYALLPKQKEGYTV